MAISIDKALGIHQPALLLRSQRAELIASNLANADTPNYKARDFDFAAQLLELAANGGPGPLRRTDDRHLDVPEMLPGGGEPGYRTVDQPSVDGNTVDSDREKAVFLDNAIRYQASLTFLEGKLRTLRSALQGDR